MADTGTQMHWLGRLVRVLVVFRTLVLLVTIMLLPADQHTWPIGLAVLLAAGLSYIPMRHWERIGPSVSRHPAYMAAEILLATVILAAAGARSPFFYFTLGTAAVAGVIYGRRGALPFAALLIAMYEFVALEGLPLLHPLRDVQSVVLIPLLYPAAVAAGVAARELINRGVTTEALLRDRTEALATERERMRVARELHDSLAKTVEGLSLSATVLSRRCGRDPAAAAPLADQLAADARDAALQARALMADLRPSDAEAGGSLPEVVRRRVEIFAHRSGRRIEFQNELSAGGDFSPLGPVERHELLSILGEALLNAQRHGDAACTTVILGRWPKGIRLTIRDDGAGISAPPDLDRLRAAGHFGLVGMHERARALGGELSVEPAQGGGTLVTLVVPDRPLPRAGDEPGHPPLGTVVAGVLRRRLSRSASARVKA